MGNKVSRQDFDARIPSRMSEGLGINPFKNTCFHRLHAMRVLQPSPFCRRPPTALKYDAHMPQQPFDHLAALSALCRTQHRDVLVVGAVTFTSKPPSVKYGGIFINDESFGLLPWAIKIAILQQVFSAQREMLTRLVNPNTTKRFCFFT